MSPDPRALAGLARSLVIYRARPWRAAALARFYRGLVGPGDLAFDIGAHVGNRSRALVAAGAVRAHAPAATAVAAPPAATSAPATVAT